MMPRLLAILLWDLLCEDGRAIVMLDFLARTIQEFAGELILDRFDWYLRTIHMKRAQAMRVP